MLFRSDLVTAGVLTNLKPTLELIRKLRTENSIGGIANKNPNAGSLVITTSALWNVLADQVENKKTIYDSGMSIPRFGSNLGWQYPVIPYGGTLITYDPDCPAGMLYVLTPESFMFEVDSDNNFSPQPWVLKSASEEGGGYYRWSSIMAETRFSGMDPFLQIKVKDLTVSGT